MAQPHAAAAVAVPPQAQQRQPAGEAAAAAAPQQQQQQAQQQQQQASYCLVRNGGRLPCSQPAGAWLEAAPRGAYTTARTVGDGARVLKLSSHVARLAQSATLMAQADAQTITSEALPPPPVFTAEQLRPCVMECIGAAIATLRRDALDCAAANAGNGGSNGAGEGGDGNGGGGNGKGAAAARQQQGQGQGQVQAQQLKLTLLMTWQAGTPGPGAPFDLWCHCEPLPPRPRPPVKLQLRGLPRSNARAKDSEWVRQRRALEASRPPDVNEVILGSAMGELMEGLSSNFFALQGGAVVTADEGVLGGTIREIVLRVCGDLGLPVELRPPKISDIESWQGAFISSTSRLLLPADELRWCAPGHCGPGGTERVRVFGLQDPLLRRLEAAVADRIWEESEAVPLPPGGP